MLYAPDGTPQTLWFEYFRGTPALFRHCRAARLPLISPRMAITILKRSSEIPDEVYQAVVELGGRPEFEGDWHVSVLPAPDNEDWQLSLESRWMRAPAIDLAPEHQSPSGVQHALHSMLELLEEES